MKNIINGSSMRFNLVITSIGIFIILLAVAFYIIMAAIEGRVPEWTTMGVFAVGAASVLTGVGYTKNVQKKIESQNEGQ